MAQLQFNPGSPKYGDTLSVGYTPASPILTGHSIHFLARSNSTTVTDTSNLGTGIVIEDVTKSVAIGTGRQKCTFPLTGDTEWSGGGADVTLDLLDSSGGVVATTTLTVQP